MKQNKFSTLGDDWKNRKDHVHDAVNDFNKSVFDNFDLSVFVKEK